MIRPFCCGRKPSRQLIESRKCRVDRSLMRRTRDLLDRWNPPPYVFQALLSTSSKRSFLRAKVIHASCSAPLPYPSDNTCPLTPIMLNTIERMESNVRGYVRSYPTVFVTSQNATMIDQDGREFIDFFAGAGTLNYGHNNPHAKAALLDYIGQNGVQHSLDMATQAKVEFIESFERRILEPRNLHYKLQFTGPTGTNAVEAAIKLARQVKQRAHIVAFTNAYHGHTLGSLALTGNRYYHREVFGSHNNVTHLPFDGYQPNLDSVALLERMLNDASSGLPIPAAVIVETIQCEGGINVATTEWMQSLASVCRRHDVLLIIDDIQVGNGRTGAFFSFETADLHPDLVCLSKSLGGGLPMSLVLIDRDCDAWQPGEHTGTFRGNNLAFVASQALLETYWQDDTLMYHVAEKGKLIEETLHRLASHSAGCPAVRGRGMVWGMDIGDGQLSSEIVRECFERNLILETAGATGSVLKFLPPLTIESDTLREGLHRFVSAYTAVTGTSVTSNQVVSSTAS